MYKPTRTQPSNASAQKASRNPAAPQTRRPPAPPAPAARPVPKVLQKKTAGSMSPLNPRAENKPKPQAVQQPRPTAKVLQPKTRAAALPANRQHAAPPFTSAQRTRPAPSTLQTKSAARPEAFKRQPPSANAPSAVATKAKPKAPTGRPHAGATAARVGTLQRKPSAVVPSRPRFELRMPAVIIPSASGVIQRSAAAAVAAPVKAPAKAPGIKYRAISLANLKAYIASDDYYVNATQQYYEVHGKKREYGVKIKIIRKDKSADSIMTWVHFHYTAGGSVDSAHFKNGGSKGANQGFDLDAGDAATLINALIGAGVSSGTWTSIKSIYDE